MECYEALYRHFTDHTEFLEQQQSLLQQELALLEECQGELKTAKDKVSKAKRRINEIKEMSVEEWKENGRQMKIVFPEDEIEE